MLQKPEDKMLDGRKFTFCLWIKSILENEICLENAPVVK
jgi:hypothetical protein